MYCIKCGVKLAHHQKECPLCGTVVFHPDIQPSGEPSYPAQQKPAPQMRSQAALVIVTTLFLIPLLITLLCDMQINGSVTWSGYVVGALTVCYTMFVLPYWFRNPNPVIFVPCSFAAVGVFLLYISWATNGGWFLSFAFPVTGGVCLIVTAVVTLLRYVPRGGLYIIGGAFIALGAFMPLMEFLLNLTFNFPQVFIWSIYPLVVLVLLGAMLIFLAICRPARETMEQKFFL